MRRPRRVALPGKPAEPPPLVEPAFDEEGRTVCPQCLSQDHLEVTDYGLTRSGRYYFIHVCKKCKVAFRYEADMKGE